MLLLPPLGAPKIHGEKNILGSRRKHVKEGFSS